MKFAALLLASLALALPAHAQLVIAHRGASGERPEHTLAAYERAIDQGADYIEPDLVPTGDGVLVARHENELSDSTDVAERPEFARRKTTKAIDGETVTGWFTEDFTLEELRTLRARERLSELRPANARFDGLYQVPTFPEIVALVKAKEAETGRRIGIYPELKHPTHFAEADIDVASLLLADLERSGYGAEDDPAFIQSFEVGTLESLDRRTGLRLVQLVSAEGGPADRPRETYAGMLDRKGLTRIARYADGIGAPIALLLDESGKARPLIAQAKAAGLAVHAWTLRKENAFLPAPLRRGESPGATGCMAALWSMLAAAGVDGVFTDDPALALAARNGTPMSAC